MKPIHKFNGGLGATLCNKCSKIICEGLTNDLLCDNCGGVTKKYKLVRESDNLTKVGDKIFWINFGENGLYESRHEEPSVGRSLIIDFNFGNYTWLTTTITEIIEQKENYLKFKTENSVYELFINKD